MGEAVYYLKAKFESTGKAEEALRPINLFILEGSRAEDWWQEHRGQDPAIFWPEFTKQFPLVTEYLGRSSGDCNNSLAGCLDFGHHWLEDEDGDRNDPNNYHGLAYVIDDEIWYSATVWHFADWGPFADFLSKFGAVNAGWVSDEYLDPFVTISL